MSSTPVLPVIDAREASRARQPTRELREVVVTITQVATGRRQAVRVAAHNDRAARGVAMLYATILSDAPRGVDAAAQAARCLDFTVFPDNDDLVGSPEAVSPAGTPGPVKTSGSEADPQDFTRYSVVIATHPQYWTTQEAGEPEPLIARRRAELLADMVRDVFPGVRCDLVPGPVEKLDLSSGPDTGVRERLEAWVDQRMGEMLLV